MIDLSSKDILQINATVIAGAFIFLTFFSLGDKADVGQIPSNEFVTNLMKTTIALSIIILFVWSSLLCIRGKKDEAIHQLKLGLIALLIVSFALLGFTYYIYFDAIVKGLTQLAK